MRISKITLTTFLLVLVTNQCFAEDNVTLKGTAVIGNSEMPNVLYVVPWKKPPEPNLNPELHESLIEDQLRPIDRNVFVKRIKHFYSNK
jgi:hypothetical protein